MTTVATIWTPFGLVADERGTNGEESPQPVPNRAPAPAAAAADALDSKPQAPAIATVPVSRPAPRRAVSSSAKAVAPITKPRSARTGSSVIPIPRPRPATRPTKVTDASEPPPGSVRYTPPVPVPETPQTSVLHPVVTSARLQSTASPVPTMSFDAGAALGQVAAANIKGSVASPQGSSGLVSIPPGTHFNGQATVRDGVLTDAGLNFTDAQGQRRALRALIIGVYDAKMGPDRKIKVGTDLGHFDRTSDFIKADTVPVDPHKLVAALGVDRQIPITGTARPGPTVTPEANDLAKSIDLRTAQLDATVQLAASATPVSFGNGVKIAFAEGSNIRVQRSPGRNIYTVNANINSATLGERGGATVNLGRGTMSLVAEETLVNGRSHWAVRVLGANKIDDARIEVPVSESAKGPAHTDHLELGSISTLANNGAPIITMENGRINLGFNTTVSNITGDMRLTDAQGRQASLSLGNPRSSGNPMTIGARIDLSADTRDPTKLASLKVSADTQGLNVAVNAPDGVEIVRGDGLSFGVRDGTSVTGNGRLTFERTAAGTSNFSIESRDGYHARVRVDQAQIQRRLGDIGIEANLDNQSYLEANVRKYDWRSGAMSLGVDVKAHLTTAALTMPELQGQLSNAGGTLRSELDYKPGDKSPTIRGELAVEIEAKPGQDPKDAPRVQFALPTSVEGFNRPGEGAIQTQLVNGKLTARLPFTVDDSGAFISSNAQTTGATSDFNNVDLISRFRSAGSSALAPELPMSDLDDADRRHAAALAAAPEGAIPPLKPLPGNAAQSPTDAINDVTTRLDAPALLGGSLQDIDLDLTSRFSQEHNFRIFGGVLGMGALDITVPKGEMRFVVESDSGHLVTKQGATRPDGSPNPTAGQPSGIRFNPPLIFRENGAEKPSDSGFLETTAEITGIDIVKSPDDPNKISFVPRLGRVRGVDAWVPMVAGVPFGGSDQLAAWAVKSMTGIDKVPSNTAELAQMVSRAANLHIDLDANVVQRILASTPVEHRDFVRDALAHTTVAARGTLRDNVTIPLGADHLTIKKGEPLVVTNDGKRVEIRAGVELGDTSLTTPNASLTMSGARTQLHIVRQHGKTAIELKNLQARDLSLRTDQPGAAVLLQHASVGTGNLTIRTDDVVVLKDKCVERTTVEGSLSDLTIGAARFTGHDGSTYALTDGKARAITFERKGAVSADGLTGAFSANALIQGSQVYIRSARLHSGSFRMDENGEMSTSPLALSNVRSSLTKLKVTQNGAAPSGISANIHRLDADFDQATLSITSANGLNLTTPKDKPGRIRVLGDAQFELPSPKMRLQITDGHSDGLVHRLFINRRNGTEGVDISDWFINGYASGTIVAGPPGSQASNLTIARGSRIKLHVDQLGLTTGRQQHIASAITGRIEGEYSLPPLADASKISASFNAKGTIDLSIRNQDDVMRAFANFHVSEGHVRADFSLAPEEVRSDVQSTVDAVRRKLNVPPTPRPRRPADSPPPAQVIPMPRPARRTSSR